MSSDKSRSRRAEIRKNRPDAEWIDWKKFKEKGVPASLGIAFVFFLVASSILMLRQDVVPYRPGQWVHHDIVSRVKFTHQDPLRLEEKQRDASNRQPRVYTKNRKTEDVWRDLEEDLRRLPEQVVAGHLPPGLTSGAMTALRKNAQNREL